MKIKKLYTALTFAVIASSSFGGQGDGLSAEPKVLPFNTPMSYTVKGEYLKNADKVYSNYKANGTYQGRHRNDMEIYNYSELEAASNKDKIKNFDDYARDTRERYKDKDAWQSNGCSSKSTTDLSFQADCMSIVKDDYKKWQHDQDVKNSVALAKTLGLTNEEALKYAKEATLMLYDEFVTNMLGDYLNDLASKHEEEITSPAFYSSNILQFKERYLTLNKKRNVNGENLYNDETACANGALELERLQGSLDAVGIELRNITTEIRRQTQDSKGNSLPFNQVQIKLGKSDNNLRELFDNFNKYKEVEDVINQQINDLSSTLKTGSTPACSFVHSDYQPELREIKVMSDGSMYDKPIYSHYDFASPEVDPEKYKEESAYFYLPKVNDKYHCYPVSGDDKFEYREEACKPIGSIHQKARDENGGYRKVDGEAKRGRPISFTMLSQYTANGLPDPRKYNVLLGFGDETSVYKSKDTSYNIKGLFSTISSLARLKIPASNDFYKSTSSKKTVSEGGDVWIFDIDRTANKFVSQSQPAIAPQHSVIDGKTVKDRVWLTNKMESGYLRSSPQADHSGLRYVLANQSKMTNKDDAAESETNIQLKFGLFPMPKINYKDKHFSLSVNQDKIEDSKATETSQKSRFALLDSNPDSTFTTQDLASDLITTETSFGGNKFLGTKKGNIYNLEFEDKRISGSKAIALKGVMDGKPDSQIKRGKNIDSSKCTSKNIGCGQDIRSMHATNSNTLFFSTEDYVGYVYTDFDNNKRDAFTFTDKPIFKDSSAKIKSFFSLGPNNYLVLSNGKIAEIALSDEKFSDGEEPYYKIKIREVEGEYNSSITEAKQIVSDGDALYWLSKDNYVYAQKSKIGNVAFSGPSNKNDFIRFELTQVVKDHFKNAIGELKNGSTKDMNIILGVSDGQLTVAFDNYITQHKDEFDYKMKDDISLSGFKFTLPLYSEYPEGMIWEMPVKISSGFKMCNLPPVKGIYDDMNSNQLRADFMCNSILPKS
jgi:hypothetical protein